MTDLFFDAVFGQGKAAGLEGFLQGGFVVFSLRFEIGAFDAFGKQVPHHFLRLGEIRIKANGGKHRFHSIGKDGGSSESAAFQLARAQIKPVADIHFQSDFRQHAFIDQARAQTRQLAFGQLGERVKQHFGDGVVQNRIADKLETFVVFRMVAAVGQRLLQKRGIFEMVTQFILNGGMRLLF